MIVIPYAILTTATLAIWWLLQIGQPETKWSVSGYEFVTSIGAVTVVAIGSAIIGAYQDRKMIREMSEWDELNR